MDLKSTLRRFLPKETPKPTRPTRTTPDLDPIFRGQEIETPMGVCYVVEKSFSFGEPWGDYKIYPSLAKDSLDGLALLGAGDIPALNPARTLFLDTETTGLAGGTGTYAFLVGVGRFTDDGFVVKQFLMRDYNEELALLYGLEQELKEAETIVSFNGKTFDIPLLKTRFAISRLDFAGVNHHHQVDLLHMARRLWRSKLESCSLGSLESNILGLTRTDDIPGFEIPQRYFEFLQAGDGTLLQDILEHNVLDIVSMAVLIGVINTHGLFAPDDCECPWEAESLGQIYANGGDFGMALRFIDRAWTLSYDKEQQIRLLRNAALLNKRRKNYTAAADLWQRLLRLAEDDLMAYEELAKYYEHRQKDFDAAGQITRRALAIALRSRSPKVSDLEHRLNRITRRQTVS